MSAWFPEPPQRKVFNVLRCWFLICPGWKTFFCIHEDFLHPLCGFSVISNFPVFCRYQEVSSDSVHTWPSLPRVCQNSWGKGSVPQDCCHCTLDANCKSQVFYLSPVFQSEDSAHDPHLSFCHLLEWLRRCFTYVYWFVVKDTTQPCGQCDKVKHRKWLHSFHALPGAPSQPHQFRNSWQ